jgi:hypothetical protein
VAQLAPDPAASFPDAAGTDAALEAMYRFLQNEEVKPQRILAPHIEATVARCRSARSVVIAHDTTEFSFSGERDGLGRINDGGHGFFGHFALAIDVGAHRKPLGVLGLQTYTRQGAPKRNKHTECTREEERESFRWASLAAEVGALADAVHVMDSEADAYWLFERLLDGHQRFVIRLTHDRALVADDGTRILLEDAAELMTARFARDVQLAARSAPHREKSGRKRNLARSCRAAALAVSAGPVRLARPSKGSGARTLSLNLVHVREVDAPEGAEHVDWKLLTTEPIESQEQIEAVIDAYRARWRIEELFKALKTGCAFEKRQLESLPALLNALAVLTPIAVHLLTLRTTANDAPASAAADVLNPVQLRILERHKNTRLRPNASAREAMLAVARLGGHIKNNGDPGWIVLGRGYEKLLAFEEGARALGVV